MMLPLAKHVEPNLAGQLDGLQQVVNPLGRADHLARFDVRGQFDKGINAYLELTCWCAGGIR